MEGVIWVSTTNSTYSAYTFFFFRLITIRIANHVTVTTR